MIHYLNSISMDLLFGGSIIALFMLGIIAGMMCFPELRQEILNDWRESK